MSCVIEWLTRLHRCFPPDYSVFDQPQSLQRRWVAPSGPSVILNQGTAHSCIRKDEDAVESVVIRIQPLETFTRPVDHFAPVFGSKAEAQVRWAGVEDSHKHAPEEELDCSIRHVKEA